MVGLCCLVKLEDEETAEVAYTKVACKLLDCKTARCSDYPNRQQHVADCIQLTPERLQTITWLPPSCAYRRLNEGKNLPSWHYLNTGSRQSVIKGEEIGCWTLYFRNEDINEMIEGLCRTLGALSLIYIITVFLFQ